MRRIGSKAKVVVYGSSQLGGDGELLKKLKLGTVDLVFALDRDVVGWVPIFGVFEMPYLVKDRAHIGEEISRPGRQSDDGPDRGKGWAITSSRSGRMAPVQITNSKHPIKVPEDLKGLKLRVPGGRWRVKMFKAYGANPSPLAFSEVFVALQTGVMDAQENPLAQIYPSRFYEVQRYFSMTGHVYTPAFVTAGASWAQLPADVQKIFKDIAAGDAGREVYKIAAGFDEACSKSSRMPACK